MTSDISYLISKVILQEEPVEKRKKKRNKAPHAKEQKIDTYSQAIDTSQYDELLAKLSGD